jgi:hypothetical protein
MWKEFENNALPAKFWKEQVVASRISKPNGPENRCPHPPSQCSMITVETFPNSYHVIMSIKNHKSTIKTPVRISLHTNESRSLATLPRCRHLVKCLTRISL